VVSRSGFGFVGAHQRDGFEGANPSIKPYGEHQRANATNTVVDGQHECTNAAHTVGEYQRADAADTVGEHQRANAADTLEII
jgi:hypothetical protein